MRYNIHRANVQKESVRGDGKYEICYKRENWLELSCVEIYTRSENAVTFNVREEIRKRGDGKAAAFE